MRSPTGTVAILALLVTGCAAQQTPSGVAQPAQRLPEAGSARTVVAPVSKISLDDVVAMAKAGQPGDEIVNRIRSSGTRLHLRAEDVISLRDRGVPLAAINQIIELDRSAMQADMAEEMIRRDNAGAEQLKRAEQEWASRCSAYCGPPYAGPGYWPGAGPGFYWWFGR